MSSEGTPPVPMRPQRHTGSSSPVPPIPNRRPNRVKTSELNDLMQNTDDQLKEMQNVIQKRSSDSKSHFEQLKDQEDNLQRGKEDLLGTSELEYELQEEKERLLEKKEAELKERKIQQEAREKELELLEKRRTELMKEREREVEQEKKRQKELELEDQKQRELEKKQELELEAKKRELKLLEQEQLLAREKSARIQKSKHELKSGSKQEETKEFGGDEVIPEKTNEVFSAHSEYQDFPRMPERPRKLQSPKVDECISEDQKKPDLEIQEPMVPGKRPQFIQRSSTETSSTPGKRQDAFEKKLSNDPLVLPDSKERSLEKHESAEPSPAIENKFEIKKVEPPINPDILSENSTEALRTKSTEPSKISQEDPASVDTKSSTNVFESSGEEPLTDSLGKEISHSSHESRQKSNIEDSPKSPNENSSILEKRPSNNEKESNLDDETKKDSFGIGDRKSETEEPKSSLTNISKQPSYDSAEVDEHQDKFEKRESNTGVSTTSDGTKLEEIKTTGRRKTQEEMTLKPVEPSKKKAPPVPKKPSSRIVAFQEMLKKQQMEDVRGTQSQEPVVTREDLGDRKNSNDHEGSSESLETTKSSPQPIVPQRPTRQPINAERSKFANNLNGLFALPGMSPMGGLPPSVAKKLGPNSPTPEQEEKKETPAASSSISDVRLSRARGPRGRKLPSNVASVEKVNSESKTNEIEIFKTWKTVSLKKEYPMVPERPTRTPRKNIESNGEKVVEVTNPTHFDIDDNKAVRPIEETENIKSHIDILDDVENGSQMLDGKTRRNEEQLKQPKTSQESSEIEELNDSGEHIKSVSTSENLPEKQKGLDSTFPKIPSRRLKYENEPWVSDNSSEKNANEAPFKQSLEADGLLEQEKPSVPKRPSGHNKHVNTSDKESSDSEHSKQKQFEYENKLDFQEPSSGSSENMSQTTCSFTDSQNPLKDNYETDLLTISKNTDESQQPDSDSKPENFTKDFDFAEKSKEDLPEDDDNE